MRSQYQSLSSHDDDASPVAHRVAAFEVDAPAAPTAVLAAGGAAGAVLGRKQRQAFYYLVGSLFVLGFIGVVAVINARGGLGGVKPVALGGANVFAADGSSDHDADTAKQLHKKLHELFAGLEPCKRHCDDACVVTPVADDDGHVTRLCCDWAYDRHLHLQTCSQTFHPETGACLCTPRYVHETVERRLEALLLPTTRPADDAAAPADASPRPSAMPTIPPWSQYVPAPYDLWHTRTPSTAPSVAVQPPAAPAAAAEPAPQPPTGHDHRSGPSDRSDHSDADESSEDAEDETDATDAAPSPSHRHDADADAATDGAESPGR
jgi:hypothetical protein